MRNRLLRLALVGVKFSLDFIFCQHVVFVLRLEGPIAVFADGSQRMSESYQTQIPLRHGSSLAHLGGRA